MLFCAVFLTTSCAYVCNFLYSLVNGSSASSALCRIERARVVYGMPRPRYVYVVDNCVYVYIRVVDNWYRLAITGFSVVDVNWHRAPDWNGPSSESGEIWLYSRRIDEFARTNPNFQKRCTRELCFSVRNLVENWFRTLGPPPNT